MSRSVEDSREARVDLERIDSLVVKLMGHAWMAKAYDKAIRRDPVLADGFGRLAERHRAAVLALSGEIGQAAAELEEPRTAAAPLKVVGG